MADVTLAVPVYNSAPFLDEFQQAGRVADDIREEPVDGADLLGLQRKGVFLKKINIR